MTVDAEQATRSIDALVSTYYQVQHDKQSWSKERSFIT